MNDSSGHYKFEIDFSQVREISADPKERLPFFTAFKTLLIQEKEKIQAWHRQGVGGREVIQAHTSLIDKVIRHLITRLITLKPYSQAKILEDFALVAVGGYGRGEMNPFSDIDLLFLRPEKFQKTTDLYIQDLISIFWGIGMEIGHSCRTVKECVQLAKEDMTIKTSMIETRFLIGDKGIYEKFNHSFDNNVLKKNVRAFLQSKLKEKYDRYGTDEGLICAQEPNVKEGLGGLRDYHTALWATAVRFGGLSLREIGANDMISTQEINDLYESVNFILRVRNELHYLMGKKSDVLRLDVQKDLAKNLGYVAETDTARAENFMQDYFLHATNVFKSSQTIFELCRQSKNRLQSALETFTQTSLGDGFIAKGQALALEGDAKEIFQNDKTLLLKLFTLCMENDLKPDIQLKRHIRRYKHLLDEEYIKSQGAQIKEFLFSILKDSGSVKSLRLLHESEILGQVLPEFGQAHCMVNYDFYHRYTADEHSIRMIRFLEQLAGSNGTESLELAEIYQNLPEQFLLKFAFLLMSIGKDHGSQTRSNQIAILSGIAERFRLIPRRLRMVSFLIENQNEMIETALHQDIHQPAIILGFAKKAGDEEGLKLLYLMSYAELRAVAPGTWTSWKNVLLSDLYCNTLEYLRRPESLKEKPAATRDEVLNALKQEVTIADIEQHLNELPDDYLLSATSAEVALHLRLIRSLKEKPYILHHEYHEEGKFQSVTLCCLAKLEAFKKLVGTLTAKNMNIRDARIYLKKDGIVIITVQVAETKEDPNNLEVWKNVKENLGKVFAGELDLKTLFKTRPRFVTGNAQQAAIIPKVKVNNMLKTPFTEIRIEARDHIGMLYKISKVFADMGIQVHHAKISIRGGRGIDVFYVSLNGKKILLPRLIHQVKAQMVQILLVDRLEDIA
jgi:[protein-PII] uridylyltransferase